MNELSDSMESTHVSGKLIEAFLPDRQMTELPLDCAAASIQTLAVGCL
jgi:hypothetical protein